MGNMHEEGITDWGAWSREAVRLMQERNNAWQQRLGLSDCPFQWNINTATITFRCRVDEVIASVCVVGTTSAAEGTFLWGWANESIPPMARTHLDRVKEFGARHQLPLLTTPEFPRGHSEPLEVLAVAGRVLDAEGVFIHPAGDLTFFFALSDFQICKLDPS
jgi:hypothetical protein